MGSLQVKRDRAFDPKWDQLCHLAPLVGGSGSPSNLSYRGNRRGEIPYST